MIKKLNKFEMKRDLMLLVLGMVLSGFTMFMMGQNGSCGSPNAPFDYISSVSSPTFSQCVNYPTVASDNTITLYYSVNSSSDGTLGVIQSILASNDCSSSNLWASRTYALYDANDCDGTPIAATTPNAGNSTTLNPEWTNLQSSTSYILMIQMTVPATGCSTVQDVCLDIYYPAGVNCSAEVGSYTVTTDGTVVSNGQEYTLTADGQTILITNNGDVVLSPDAFDPGDATSGFLIFDQAPSMPIDPNNLTQGVNGFLGAFAGNSIDDAMANGSSSSVSGTNALWFVPTTFDTGGNGGALYVDSNGDGCYEMSDPIQVNYQLTTEDCGDCSNPACPIYFTNDGSASPSMTYPASNHIDVNLNGPTQVTQCHLVTVQNDNQTLGFRQSIYQSNVGCATRTYTLHAADANGQCTGNPIPSTGNGPYSGIFNPEWDYLPAGDYIMCITQDLPVGCDMEYTNTGYYLEDLPVVNTDYNCGTVDFTMDAIGPFDCTDGIVNLVANDPPDAQVADEWIYPGFIFTVSPSGFTSWNGSVSIDLYINGVVVYSFVPSSYGLSGQDEFIIPITYAQPESFSFGVSYPGGTGETFDFNILNAADNTVADAGTWTIGGTTVSNVGIPVGSAIFSGPGVTNDPDNGGKGFFDPSVAGPGTHTITYTWDNGDECTGTMSYDVVVNGPSAPTANDVFYCLNQTASALTATGSNLQWYTSATGGTASSTAPTPSTSTEGVTSYWVSDASGSCESARTEIQVTVSGSLDVTAVVTDVNCNGDCDGAINVTVQGGASPYIYNWDNGSTDKDLIDVCAGDYVLNVADNSGCSATFQATIEEPTALFLATASSDETCNGGGCDGSVNVIPTGGINQMNGNNYAYSIEWFDVNSNSIATQANPTGLCAGTYTVTVTDNNGCVATDSEVVGSSSSTQVMVIDGANPTCNGGNDGYLVLAFSDPNNGPFQYSTDGVNFTPYSNGVNGLSAGVVNVTIQDGSGCTSATSVELFDPAPVNIDVSSDTTICIGGQANVWAYAYGGVPGYTFQWDNGSTNAFVLSSPTQTTSYSVTAYDGNGCPSETVSSTVYLYQPLSFDISSAAATVCPGEEVIINTNSITGGSGQGYTIDWSPTPANGVNPQTGAVVFEPQGSQTITATLSDNCETPAVVNTINIDLYNLPVANLSTTDSMDCGSLATVLDAGLNATEITSYQWTYGHETSSEESPSVELNEVGVYDVTLNYTTIDGCSAEVSQVAWLEVLEEPIAIFTASTNQTTILDPLVTLDGFESYGADQYSWENLGTNESLGYSDWLEHEFTTPGEFPIQLTVTSTNGCVDSTVQVITVEDDFTLFVPNAFAPDGEHNQVFQPKGLRIDNGDYEMWIYDRWGNMVFYSNDYYLGWDGTTTACEGCNVNDSGHLAQTDVYVWIISVKTSKGTHKETGHVTLVR